MGSPVFDDKSTNRKMSIQLEDIDLTKADSSLKTTSVLKKSSVADFMRVRKESSIAVESEL